MPTWRRGTLLLQTSIRAVALTFTHRRRQSVFRHRAGHPPVDEAHKYRTLHEYVIKPRPYDLKTGAVRRLSETYASSK